jgi:threonine dehydrogenase-like Zn-dependent dehydrogenase
VRALVFNKPWDLTVENVPDPSPGPGEVVFRVVATGICGSDIHGFTGENGRRHPGQVMGHETVGKVEEVGDGVDPALGLTPGAVVTVNPLLACGTCPACSAGSPQSCPQRRVIGVTPEIVSAFADRLVCPAQNAVVLPADMPVEYGALVEPLSVGYHAAVRGRCSPDDRVLVVGGGPIGQACVLAARRLGATRVAVTELDPERRSLAGSLGAVGIDPRGDSLVEEVAAVLGGPATLVIDAVGVDASVADAMRCSDFGARVVLVGMGSPRLALPAYSVSTEERTLVGSFCYSYDEFRATAEWVGSGPDVLAGLIDGHVDLDRASDAFTRLARGEWSASKVLVHPLGVPETQ